MKLFSRLLILSMLFIGFMVSCQTVATTAEKQNTIEKVIPDIGISFALESTVNSDFDIGEFNLINVGFMYVAIIDRVIDVGAIYIQLNNENVTTLEDTPQTRHFDKHFNKKGIGLTETLNSSLLELKT